MTMIRDYINVKLQDTFTKKIEGRDIQDRSLFEYRNKGFSIVHLEPRDSYCNMPVVIETYEQLRRYHRPEYVYQFGLRQSYNIPTFATFYGVLAASPSEPFSSMDQLLPFRTFSHLVPHEDRPLLLNWVSQEKGARHTVQLQFDALASSPTASCFVTSAPQLEESFLRNFHSLSHFMFYFVSRATKGDLKAKWLSFFSKPVHLYVGFGTDDDSSRPSPAAVQCAQKLHIRLFQRKALRYFPFF